MLLQLETNHTQTIAFEIVDGFTENDELLAQKYFQQKIDEGHEYINVLVKLDELKINKSSTKAFMEDIIWLLRHYKQLGNLAIVAHSNILKALVPIDNFFFERLRKGFEERYFDSSQMEKAMDFVSGKQA
ncbi:STAS/SEC14 domain-containing protein [Tenacibaculum sp. TC6]|uniref:STAS/SEC14 domain-containing protein n=1 Tax=Tenacibaculum sp. TC6 TaxID=3423223 RepID=UPI003D360B79